MNDEPSAHGSEAAAAAAGRDWDYTELRLNMERLVEVPHTRNILHSFTAGAPEIFLILGI